MTWLCVFFGLENRARCVLHPESLSDAHRLLKWSR